MTRRPVGRLSAGRASPSSLMREIRTSLASLRDPAYFEFIVKSIGVRDRVIGVRVPAIREAAKAFLASHPELAVDGMIELMDRCAARCVREELLFGTFALTKFRRKFPADMLDSVEGWIDAVDNWETCDQLAMNVAAYLVARDIREASRLDRWSRSDNPWRRRFSLATAAALNQKGRRFPLETLRVCANVLDDPDPQVRKAVGWAIREASEQDEAAAFVFLRDHRGGIHPRVLREASEKLTVQHRDELLGSTAGDRVRSKAK